MKIYLSNREKAMQILHILMLVGASLKAFSQHANELSLMGHRNGFTSGLFELGDYYYYNYSQVKDITFQPYRVVPMLLEEKKFHKSNYSFLQTVTLAGDTTQADSGVITGTRAYYTLWNGNIAFVANEQYDSSYHAYLGLTFSVMDTAMNMVIAQRRIKYVPWGGQWEDAYMDGLCILGTRLAVFYSQQDTGRGPHKMKACVILIDKNGQIVTDSPVAGQERFVHVVPMPRSRCMVKSAYTHILLDSNLNVVDTFHEKPLYMPSGPYRGYFSNGGFEIALPSGTLIRGGEYSIMKGPSGGTTTALSRLSAATRYSSDTTVLFFNGNNESPADGYYPQHLQYNAFDNRIYYANSSRQWSGYNCLDSFNYVQVICTDTLLRPLWRKFITLGPNRCATANWVAASDGRGGVGVMGYHYDMRYDMHDTAHSGSFLFHLDSTGAVSINGGPAPVVRDRLKIYPNPATDVVVIDDILGGLSGFALYDMSGRLVRSATATGKLAKVSIEELPAGPYILRVLLSDGNAVSQTIVKR